MARTHEIKPIQLISTGMLLGSLEAANELGINVEGTLKEYDINPRILKEPEGFLSADQLIGFLETIADRFNCTHFGFLVGKHHPPLNFWHLTLLLKFSPNIKIALANVIAYNALYSEEVIVNLACNNGYAYFTRQDRTSYHYNRVQLHTLGVTLLFKLLQTLCGHNWKATTTSFAHLACLLRITNFPKNRQSNRL